MIDTEYFRIEEGSEGTCIRFADTSRFDTDDYAQLQRDLVDFVESRQPRKLLVDLGEVVYCSTALINALLMAERRVRAERGNHESVRLERVHARNAPAAETGRHVFSVCGDESAAQNA
jgi:hypothetical protein